MNNVSGLFSILFCCHDNKTKNIWSRLNNKPTYIDDGISSAFLVIISGFVSGLGEVFAWHGGSGGLTGGRMIESFSPGGHTLLKLSESPGREQ